MNLNRLADVAHLRPPHIAPAEWEQRVELAACYRLFDWLGWAEMIYNHITVRVEGGTADNPHYLINPFGLHYTEVTARNLVKIDARGNKLDDNPWPVNPAGFTIHSVIHIARPDAHCVMHTHTTAGVAVACKRDGLRHDNFYSAQLYGRVGYHDFEGVTTHSDEGPRLVASLGTKEVLILRNHGLLVASDHLPMALNTLWTLQRGCEVQLASDTLRGETLPIPQSILETSEERNAPVHGAAPRGRNMFDGILRRAGIRYADVV